MKYGIWQMFQGCPSFYLNLFLRLTIPQCLVNCWPTFLWLHFALALKVIGSFLSRAFYGWLSHVRQLKVARQHLSDLAFHDPLPSFNNTWSSGVTTKWWNEQKKILLKTSSPYASKESLLTDELQEDQTRASEIKDLEREIHLRIYYGGIEPCVRKQVGLDEEFKFS